MTCKTTTCPYNKRGLCIMYNEERTDEMRTIEFYEKYNKIRLPKINTTETYKREGDM